MADQLDIVRRALGTLKAIRNAGELIDLGNEWPDDAWKVDAGSHEGDDQRSPRDTEPRYQHEEDRVAAEAAMAG